MIETREELAEEMARRLKERFSGYRIVPDDAPPEMRLHTCTLSEVGAFCAEMLLELELSEDLSRSTLAGELAAELRAEVMRNSPGPQPDPEDSEAGE